MKRCNVCGFVCRDEAKYCAGCGCRFFSSLSEAESGVLYSSGSERGGGSLSRHADNAALGMNAEMLGRYSEAGKQFKVAYDGVDNAAGQQLKKGLKQISQSRVHPDYAEQNINQQAGFSAEVLDTAKQNAEYAKRGEAARTSRTDDLGRVNDTKADQVTLDANGNIVRGSEVQIKFLKSPKSFVDNVSGRKYQEHYQDGKFRVPADQYDGIKDDLDKKIDSLEGQRRTPEKDAQLKYLKKVRRNLQRSEVSKEEAVYARINPGKATGREILKVSHEAAFNAVKTGAAVGGGMSLLSNTWSVLSGEKDAGEAAADVALDTAKAGAVSYGTAYVNTALASVMKNSANAIVRDLAASNAPAIIVQTAVSTVKSLGRLCQGEIDLAGFFVEIGKNGTALVASMQGATQGAAWGAAVGGPVGAVVGGLIGGLVGSLVCDKIYNYAVGLKALHAEMDAFTDQIRRETVFLKAYQVELLRYDLDRFKRETAVYNEIGAYISGDYSAADFNTMLLLAYKYLGISSPWGNRSFDDFMNDKSARLSFG